MANIPLNTFKTRVHSVLPDPLLDPILPDGNLNSPPYAWFNGPIGTSQRYPYPVDKRYRVYQAQLGTTGVVLYAQVANIGTDPYTVTFWHHRPPAQPDSPPFQFTELVQSITVPPNDSLVLLGGKLVLQTLDSIFIAGTAPVISGSEESGYITNLKLTVSVLESANQ